MRLILITYEGPSGPVYIWMEANTEAEITASYNVRIPSPAPIWATPEFLNDYGAYRLDAPDELPDTLQRHRL